MRNAQGPSHAEAIKRFALLLVVSSALLLVSASSAWAITAGPTFQAVTVPANPGRPDAPHLTYSGANITLKGVARNGGNQYQWDFGDGSAPMAWTAISNPYNLGVRHTYTGAVGRLFVATLSVRNAVAPSVVATASYPIRVANAAFTLSTTDMSQTDVRARMANDEALWYLHVNASRATYAPGAPGYSQPYATWLNGSYYDRTGQCAVIDAFETHGSEPGGDPAVDPYVDDVQRGLNYALANAGSAAIGMQFAGNPDVNGNAIGVDFPGTSTTETTGACALALEDSHAPTRIAATGLTQVQGRTYSALVQDAVDWLAWAQNDVGAGNARGDWGYTANDGTYSDLGLLRMPILALGGASGDMEATVPAFVRSELAYYLAYTRHTGLDVLNGGWGYSAPSTYVTPLETADGLLGEQFVGKDAASPEIQAGVGYMYRNWNGSTGEGGGCWDANLGFTGAMYGIARVMHDAGLTRATNYDYNAHAQTASSLDWYYTPFGQALHGYGTDLILRQQLDGSWDDTNGCSLYSRFAQIAWDTMVLAKGAPAAPVVDAGGPYAADQNVPITFDASRSAPADAAGGGLSFQWSLNGMPIPGATGPTASLSFAEYGTENVCVRVADELGRSSSACPQVVVSPPPHPPTARLAPTYQAYAGIPKQFDASASSDPDGDPLTYAWDFHNAGTYSDATGATPTFTFTTPGTYAICVQAADHPDQNAHPYAAGSSTSLACSQVTVTDPPPAPSAPTGLTATAGDGHVQLSWTAASGATSYKVLRGTTAGGESATPIATPSGTSFDDTGATNGTTYYYEVVAGNAGGDSTPSNEAHATPQPPAPSAPTGLAASASAGSVALTWDPTPGAAAYEVLRGTTSGGESPTPVATVLSASYLDTDVADGSTYYYEVVATNSGGSSAPSSEVSATPPLLPPTDLTATASTGQVALTWSPTTGATGYQILRGNSVAGPFTPVGSPTDTTYTDTGLTNGMTYYYEVVANSAGGSSAPSDQVHALPLAVPSGLGAAPGDGQVALTWSPVSGATSYRVFRGTTPGGESATALGTVVTAAYTDNAVTNGNAYYYKVVAVNADGVSDASSEVHGMPQVAAPPAPASLTAAAGDSQVALSWPAAAGATGYRVLRGDTAGSESVTPIATPSGHSFVDTGVTNGSTYWYEVVATDAGGDSARSPEVSATPHAPSHDDSPGPPDTPAAPQSPVDTAPPSLVLEPGTKKLKDALAHGVKLKLSCSEACTLGVALTLDFKTAHGLHIAAAKKPVKVGAAHASLAAPGRTTVKIALSKKAKRALRHRKSLKLTAQVTATDGAGNAVVTSRTLSLH